MGSDDGRGDLCGQWVEEDFSIEELLGEWRILLDVSFHKINKVMGKNEDRVDVTNPLL